MQNEKKEAEQLINELKIDEKAKRELLNKLTSEGITDDLLVDIQVALVEAQEKLNKQHQPIVNKLKKIAEEEDKAMKKVYDKFDQQMNQLEETADMFYKTVSTQMDQQKIEDARKKLRTKAG